MNMLTCTLVSLLSSGLWVHCLCICLCKQHILVSETCVSSYPGFGTEMRDSGWDVNAQQTKMIRNPHNDRIMKRRRDKNKFYVSCWHHILSPFFLVKYSIWTEDAVWGQAQCWESTVFPFSHMPESFKDLMFGCGNHLTLTNSFQFQF